MKMTHLLTVLALGASSLLASAQEAKKDAPAGGPGGPGGPGGRPIPPIIAALDTNKDGVIDATELANATASLKALDKDGDGKLSPEELRPARGPGGPGGDRGPREGGDRGPRPDGERKGREGAPAGEKKDAAK
ncbi:MAG: hypothetical protein QOE70_5035 [Chthoniobacter sp.]|nr:hypothetical protein [Chthoniobacter sp.]